MKLNVLWTIGNAYSTNPSGTKPQYPGSTAAQYPNQPGGTTAQYNNSTGSGASTSQQPFGNQYGAYYGSNFYGSGNFCMFHFMRTAEC